MVQKPFDPALFKKFDPLARRLFKNLLPKNLSVKDNKIKTGVDCIVFKDSKHIFNAELEVRRNCWKSGSFKYETVHIPYRKKKYFELDKPTLLCSFAPNGNGVFFIWGDIILESRVAIIHNRYMRNEKFYDVNIDLAFEKIAEAVQFMEL